MSATNSATRYGSVARSLHWLTAALILTAIGLGLYAESLPYDTSETLAVKAQYFSWHKTLGVAAFFVALVRILWALTQERPAPVHPDRKLETWAAEIVHWSLYIAMLALPLTGWIHHAAVDGFAPILWPFGQNLPFVPKSELVGQVFGSLHWLFSKLLIAAIVLHIAGALKHAVIERDGTLARMISGRAAGRPAGHPRGAGIAALVVFAAAGIAIAAPALRQTGVEPPAETAVTPAAGANWQVETGSLGFTVRQMGSEVAGQFPNWTATILFNETPDASGSHGKVTVSIDTTSLTLGSVTAQAKDAEFFDTANFATAVFEADILPATEGYEARGTLTLRGVTRPATLPFTLVITGDQAVMAGALTLDRRDFGMGASYGDESSVGFSVGVATELTARRL